MEEIKMVDLRGQYLKIKDEIDTAISAVIDSTQFINGPSVKEFQKNLETYLDVKHVIPCGNGTDALQVAMMALDLKPGDEVIVPTFTFISTAEVIALLGLTPVLVDVEPDSFNVSVNSIKKAITSKTKAIAPVHLYGQCADMEQIMEIAEQHNLYVIEDTAQALGCNYLSGKYKGKKAGTIGTIGCTSFFPSKNLGCYGDGGAIFTNNDALAARMRSVVNHGMTVRYYHDHVGVNSRLDSIQAAVLNVKLKYLDQYNKLRIKAANFYNSAFADCQKLITPVVMPYTEHVYHQYTLQANGFDRNALVEHLKEKQIPAMIYYPVPIHKQKAYVHDKYKEMDFSVSEELVENVFSLPMHTELSEEQQQYIVDTILNFIENF